VSAKPAPDLRAQVARVPEAPGVYLWKGADGRVLYVGKAKALRSRMRSYIGGHDERAMVPLMMSQVASFDYYVTKSEVDSLVLEANLIKEERPPYNVGYRDDKTFPFLALTMSDPFPALKYTREKHRAGTRYFGPFADARAARATVDVVRRVIPICRADCVEWKRVTAKGGEPTGKPCFDHHVGKGPGPCVGAITREEYAEGVAKVAAFLDGRRSGIVAELENEMRAAAADLDYERAARFRNRLEAVRAVLDRQSVVSERDLDADVIGIYREETIAAAHVFQVREGRVLSGAEFVLDEGLDVADAELVEGFLLNHYGQVERIPREVLVPALPDDAPALEGWLSGLRGGRVRLAVPVRGEKRRLLELAMTNARHAFARYSFRTRYDEARTNAALLELESALALPAPPLRIEAFDISTLHGRFSVGSMVVFAAGRADPSGYRRFRVRLDVGESDDVAMMREVLARRFAREAKEGSRFASRPDLVVVDGGKPQLAAALAVLSELGLSDVPVVALAKREEELFTPGWDEPVVLPAGSPSLHLVKRIRDEAHRFAVDYHRQLRGKSMTASILDEIPGIGPTRKAALLKAFGSVRKLGAASAETIATVPGVPEGLAADIAEYLAASRNAEGPRNVE
jgi:excinuclease ABC subunit C